MASLWVVIDVILVILDEDEVVAMKDMIFTVIIYDVASWHQHALWMTLFCIRHPRRRKDGRHDIHYDIVSYDVAMTSSWVVFTSCLSSAMKKRWSSWCSLWNCCLWRSNDVIMSCDWRHSYDQHHPRCMPGCHGRSWYAWRHSPRQWRGWYWHCLHPPCPWPE